MSTEHQYDLLCLENPLLDIQGQGDDALLNQYGLKPNDAILAEEKHLSLFEELIQNRSAKLLAGGAAQNTARGAQYILSPNSVVFFGCVGKDKYADILQEANKEAGLAVRYRYDEKTPTGRCGVIITGHNRSMCTDLAAANLYKIEHLKENWSVVENSKAYFVGGYHLTVSVPSILALAEEAAKKNSQRKRVAIITQGTEPTVIAVQGEDSVKSYPVHQIGKDEIVDTTGAGDAFAGGFFAGVVKGESIDTCVDMGQWLAAQSLRELGPSYPFPKKVYTASK